MGIITSFQPFKKYKKTDTGYKLQSQWTSSDTVELSSGKTLTEAINDGDIVAQIDEEVSLLSEKLENHVKVLSTTLPSNTNSITVSYPSGYNKDSFLILSFSYYRNASWYYDTKCAVITCANNGITIQILEGYEYIKGLPFNIIYK